MMKRYMVSLATVGLLAGASVFAPSASARDSFAVSIAVPGLAVGYANHGGYVAAYAPPPVYYYPPAPIYVAPPPPVYYAPRVVYGGPVVYHRYPWRHHHYYRGW